MIKEERVSQPGDPMREDSYWDQFITEEQMNAVWELTRLRLAWQPNRDDEPGLQSAISRIQRPPS